MAKLKKELKKELTENDRLDLQTADRKVNMLMLGFRGAVERNKTLDPLMTEEEIWEFEGMMAEISTLLHGVIEGSKYCYTCGHSYKTPKQKKKKTAKEVQAVKAV